MGDHALHQGDDVFLVAKAHLHIDLGELRLTVGAQVFVAEAFDDLVIAVHAGHHEQLFEELRRLRQGVELAGADPAGHQVVARALRGGAGEHRRFDFQKTRIVEIAAHALQGLVAQDEVARDLRPAQIQVAVLQPQGVGDLDILIQRKRRRFTGVEDAQLIHQNLDGTGFELGVVHVRRPAGDMSAHCQHPLAPELVRLGMNFRIDLRIEHHLGDAPAVAQVDEDDAAMITAAQDPAHEDTFLTEMVQTEIVAGVRAPECAH